MQRVLGQVDCPLECRFEHIRTKETNMGNFMCDIVLTALQADFVLVNSGSFRADCVVPAGDFRLGDLSRLFPMLDPLVVISIDGRTLLAALENGVSMWPALEGRFPQVSGLRFRFDGTRPPVAGSTHPASKSVTSRWLPTRSTAWQPNITCTAARTATTCCPAASCWSTTRTGRCGAWRCRTTSPPAGCCAAGCS
ncbi:hypothetical protein BOX15_Mlig025898g2 [Macrostomum lignano]|uniref:5'-Nucleotidase C-terminal domain-containing protein n=1 Tax=Macrostomum lignano TaxID=282301 RepID=A0A267EP71_9PLAT|nr:hypothetical protein BOX15_Mlig025898g2 [Macrostomum lignano]